MSEWEHRDSCEVSSVSSDAKFVSELVLVPDVTACASCDPQPARTHPRTHESQHVHPFYGFGRNYGFCCVDIDHQTCESAHFDGSKMQRGLCVCELLAVPSLRVSGGRCAALWEVCVTQ